MMQEHPNRARIHAARRGFTLVELIVAGIMISLLASATYISLSQAVKARDKGVSNGEAFTRANLAADLIAAELANTIRDSELTNTRVLITRDGRPGDGLDGILLFTNSDRPVRPSSGQPEGPEYETQFKLRPAPSSASRRGQYELWRRKDPVPDENPEGGGFAVMLVPGITRLEIQASDQTTWRDTWDSDSEGLPHGVRIVVTAIDDNSVAKPQVARRVVAIDRVPIPPQTTSEDASTGATTGSTTGGSSTSGGTSR